MSSSSIIKLLSGNPSGNKVAAFDLDDTLVSAQSLTPYPGVIKKLKELVSDGYNIVIISNQKVRHIGDKKLMTKLQKVSLVLDVPLMIFCAREEDKYRKPDIGIISLIPKECGKIMFFVGDAAGRPGDHSNCDLHFAKEAKIPFFTPEQYFDNFTRIGREEIPKSLKSEDDINFLTMVLLIGYPGSGKSCYAKILEETGDFTVINNDSLGTIAKCKKLCTEKLSKYENVVIDNLNGTVKSRKEFLDIAMENGAKCVIIHINTSMNQSIAWNEKREKKVPKVVYYTYRKRFELPNKEEGIDEIYSIVD